MSDWQPNFHWITDLLAVGGRFAPARAAELASAHGVAAVVDLREEEVDDESILQCHGIALLHLPTRDMCGVDAEHLDRGVRFTQGHLELKNRVLIHCEHGIGRSATLALCVMVHGGMAPLDALKLMKDRRAVVSPSQEQFASWCGWLTRHAADHCVDWDVPSFDAFQKIAYRAAVGD
ncbi:MAG: Dual specificity protein phosphatase [Variovorax sp.]|jgi:protein-tyrosine phosphatase|nr:Dual specificity protein phosphatase [Variovorax sp.]